MKHTHALTLAVGLASSALAAQAATPTGRDLVPLHKAGVMYINMSTGERSLTLYRSTIDNEIVPELDTANSTAALFDYWMVSDGNPCWDDPRVDSLGWGADATTDHTGPIPITEPIVGFDFGDMPFDSKITGVLINTAVLHSENIDSNGDGVQDTGLDSVMVYYDALSEGNRTSIAPPTAVVRIEFIPGNRGQVPTGFAVYELVLDFGGEHFELGDSDGINRGSMWLPGAAEGLDYSAMLVNCTTSVGGVVNCTTATNPSPDGLADFQYLQYYAKHGTDSKVTSNSTFISLGMPEGTLVTTSFQTTTEAICTTSGGLTTDCIITITVRESILIVDPLPAGQGTKESIGIGALGAGGDTTNIDWSVGGCCFWFGALDCVGYLAQLNPNIDFDATWYNLNPYAQNAHGFFSDTSSTDPCLRIDINDDGILDHGDITLWIQAKLAGDISISDLNGDGICDNGDIGTFVSLFLNCTG